MREEHLQDDAAIGHHRVRVKVSGSGQGKQCGYMLINSNRVCTTRSGQLLLLFHTHAHVRCGCNQQQDAHHVQQLPW